MREHTLQSFLILAGIVVSVLFGVFIYRELFPEYSIYQKDYLALEKFRSSYTHEPLPPFQTGIKQIVIEREDRGPALIDRCTTCHVALQIPYFSPTKIEKDQAGKIVRDDTGKPHLIPNEDYIWKKLNEKIATLRNDNQESKAASLAALKTAHVGENVYDVTKVLSLHPLMGNETFPFEYHPIEEYGCTSCHNGNGRSIVTKRAHGPVFDGQYEKEHMGYTPEFTQRDPYNDPRFATVFNGKPGEDLIFQTEPLYPGSIIQAKCVQCHRTEGISVADKSHDEVKKDPLISPEVVSLTQDYTRGKELYIAQACYACHRIAGFSRGGVGPELSKAGESYPWYLKRKMVWPQGDLPNSTMPNMRLDSAEVEDLMTFMLAQKGQNRGIAKTDYQSSVQAWDMGKKMAWEKPVSPPQMADLSYSMKVFATQGCAACHRLQGFESNVGFNTSKDVLYEQQKWFKNLFPEVVHYSYYDEELPGSEIVATIEKNEKEIDARISNNVRHNSLLEDIEKEHPELIESFYSTFRYASRAKNHYYQSLIDQENQPEKINQLIKQWDAWKTRVRNVLMIYIQTYGFGRLIGPHLNWSGIYRSDEWLMDHFKNPGGHVPRSIMPVFPFDESKFYALTYMLDELAVRNRDQLRQTWEKQGFDPLEAFNALCAQCHGVGLKGNGVIAEWIYPIPKNLRNPDFLLHLTKEQAINSITHGVLGTPMAPWGEASKKPFIPVLKEPEIQYLVNWLFSSLPGEGIIKGTENIPKWQYQADDVISEMEKEKGQLSTKKEPIFDIIDKKYFIKKEFYTPENIEEGEKLFSINCAQCHGAEAEGTGIRAGAMVEAKPRMLTNLDWIQSRDDLRLLRSIKYGVPGTGMTPFGDLTNTLQRLQMVIFIRSLTEEKEKRAALQTVLYETFDQAQLILEQARVQDLKNRDKLQDQKDSLIAKQKQFETDGDSDQAAKIYRERLDLVKEINELNEKDKKLNDLRARLKTEQGYYSRIGIQLISKNVSTEILNIYFNLIRLNKGRYIFENGQLSIQESSTVNQQIEADRKQIVAFLDQNIQALEKKQMILKGKVSTTREQLKTTEAEIESYKQLKEKLIIDIDEAMKLAA